MLSIHKINPMARAIGTMGAIMALVGGVTYAALQTNSVALADNELTSGTPLLQISNGNGFGNSATGLHAALTPGQPTPYTFYLQNNGSSPMTVTASIAAGVFSGSQIPASDVTMTLNCGSGDVTYTLDQWSGGAAAIPGTVAGGGSYATCTETVTLDSSYSPSGQVLNYYSIDFVGNE